MDNKRKIGYISGAFALKGEMTLKSRFSKIDEVLDKGEIYIESEKHKITSYKPYKGNYLIKIDNLNDINLITKYLYKDIFIENNLLAIEDIIGFKVMSDEKSYGIVTEVFKTNKYIIRLDNNQLIPYVDEYVKKIDFDKKEIKCKDLEKLLWK